MKYDAFMSYSHAGDSRLASTLQSALHRFAKPWYRLRALHVFRDKTDLSTNPRLWESIRSALDAADWLILLASPPAAASIWIQREVDHWLQHRAPDRILIVLTGGALQWDRTSTSFDRAGTDALPARLIVGFAEEPLYLDLRWAKEEGDLSTTHPRFVDAVADLAATLHGRPKDELVGEDIRQHRRSRRLACSAIAGLAVLTIASLLAAVYAMQQRKVADTQRAVAVEQRRVADTQRAAAVEQRRIADTERAAAVEQRKIADIQRAAAEEQSRIALARQLAAQSGVMLAQFPDRLPLALLLALESTRLHHSFEGNQALRAALSRLPRVAWSPRYQGDPQRARIRALAFSPDGTILAAAREDGTAELLDVRRSRSLLLLVHDEDPAVVPGTPSGRFAWKAAGIDEEVIAVAFSTNGRLVATGSNDKSARLWETATGRELSRLSHEGGEQ